MSNEIQKDEYYLPGGFSKLIVNGQVQEIKKVVKSKVSTTVTIHPIQKLINGTWTEDAEFEVIEPKQLPPTQ